MKSYIQSIIIIINYKSYPVTISVEVTKHSLNDQWNDILEEGFETWDNLKGIGLQNEYLNYKKDQEEIIGENDVVEI
jgi:hypothetical protein